MECSHNKVKIDREKRVYRCEDCGTVVGHFMTFAERTEAQADNERYAAKLRGIVSIGNWLYAKTKTR